MPSLCQLIALRVIKCAVYTELKLCERLEKNLFAVDLQHTYRNSNRLQPNLIRIVLGRTGRGAVCQCPKCLASMDGSISSRVATD